MTDTNANGPLVMERTFNAPVARVWKALTDEQDLKQWTSFIPHFKPELGFEFDFFLGPDDEHQYHHLCKVTEVIDGKKIAYSWRYEGYEGISELSYELSSEGDKTRVKLVWSGLDTFPKIFTSAGFQEGSEYTMNALGEFVEKA
ncbi:MAG TPA: SRPBCC domain-containing protein [Candidatus Saccharimonadales bacterium]|jgi:uncharacterized protein YndB with AHSA1/START domain|nr:SRPBCC domain-containing protein [Candidatus Saccharimonadales bacterium]